MTKLLSTWDHLRGQLWFIPALFCAVAIVLAIVSLEIDDYLDSISSTSDFALKSTGESARIVLGALVSALVTVCGLAFSLTIVAVTQTSSQYGPRLIRNLFESNITQNVLGLFLATIVYSMVVLRAIRDSDADGTLFTPQLSILFAEVGGACCLLGLLYLTNHVTRCMRAETLIDSVYQDLCRTIDHILPKTENCQRDLVNQQDQSQQVDWSDEPSLVRTGIIKSNNAGYLRTVDFKALSDHAENNSIYLDVQKRPGEFVHNGQELVIVYSASNHDTKVIAQLSRELQSCFDLGSTRSTRQDVEAAVLELVEIAVRAMSPGVNDPTTAINVIDYLSSFLRLLAGRCRGPLRYIEPDDHSPSRIMVKSTTFSGVLNAAFDQLRQFAASSVAVHCRLLEGLTAIGEATYFPEDRQAVRQQIEMVMRNAEKNVSEECDLEDVRQRACIALANCTSLPEHGLHQK